MRDKTLLDGCADAAGVINPYHFGFCSRSAGSACHLSTTDDCVFSTDIGLRVTREGNFQSFVMVWRCAGLKFDRRGQVLEVLLASRVAGASWTDTCRVDKFEWPGSFTSSFSSNGVEAVSSVRRLSDREQAMTLCCRS